MHKKLSGSRNQNDDDASSMKRIKTCDSSYVSPWPDLDQDVLFLVMMRLGVIDFVSFSGVCKSWRSFSLSNRKMFMASRPPMRMRYHANEKEWYCYLEDFQGRRFKTLLPLSGARWSFLGLTCGYLIFYGRKEDFLLVNPITRHQLHFPAVPWFGTVGQVKAILVYPPSIPGWVFVVINTHHHNIWFSIEGKGAWNHVSCNDNLLNLHAFKGNIYTLNTDGHLYEFRLNAKPNLSILKFKYFGKQNIYRWEFVSLGENLYVILPQFEYTKILYKLDFGKMKGVSPEEKTIGEYAIFHSHNSHGVAIKPESWAVDPRSIYKSYDCDGTNDGTQKGRFFDTVNGWYFPHLC